MSSRMRKVLGSLGMLIFLAFYVWAATAIAARLPDHWAVQVVFFAIVGTAWGLPLLPLLSWMEKGPRP